MKELPIDESRFRAKVTTIWEDTKDKVLGVERRAPRLHMPPDQAAVIREWLLKPNPRWSEVIFFGVGKGTALDKIYTPSYDTFSPDSFADGEGGRIYCHADLHEFDDLLDSIEADNRLEDLLLFGHTHPIADYYPSDADVNFVKVITRSLPTVPIPYTAIATKMRTGSEMAVFNTADVVKVTHWSRKFKMPIQVLNLDEH